MEHKELSSQCLQGSGFCIKDRAAVCKATAFAVLADGETANGWNKFFRAVSASGGRQCAQFHLHNLLMHAQHEPHFQSAGKQTLVRATKAKPSVLPEPVLMLLMSNKIAQLSLAK